jgi:hypothetical protein
MTERGWLWLFLILGACCFVFGFVCALIAQHRKSRSGK